MDTVFVSTGALDRDAFWNIIEMPCYGRNGDWCITRDTASSNLYTITHAPSGLAAAWHLRQEQAEAILAALPPHPVGFPMTYPRDLEEYHSGAFDVRSSPDFPAIQKAITHNRLLVFDTVTQQGE